ncbi:hypothetical protein A4R29_05220 [Mesorhizobium ciceri biovar biserrulae]|nr:hypothetical protein A4R29_05220 [Mesorhizobium ciceri biovar biserrulae]
MNEGSDAFSIDRAEEMKEQFSQPPAIDTSAIKRAGYIGPEGTWSHQSSLDLLVTELNSSRSATDCSKRMRMAASTSYASQL